MTILDDSLDFDLGEDLVAVRDLAEEIFTDLAPVDRVREVEAASAHDDRLWSTCASSGLLGIPLPEAAGGAGLGALGMVTLLEQQGRRVAPIRLAAVLAGAALPLARFGTPGQQQTWLEPLLEGRAIVTGAWSTDATGGVRTVAAHGHGGRWTLTGRIDGIPALPVSQAVLVPVVTDRGPAVAVLPLDRTGARVEVEHVTDQGSSGTLVLAGAEVGEEDLLTGGGAVASWTLVRLRLAQAAVQVGVCAEALATTAAYTSERHQFGRPLSTNQAVTQRAADAHLDVDAMRLTTLRAAWLLDRGEQDAARSAVLVAAWWAADAGLRVLHSTQHLHGGMGADIDYPIHRYFLWGRQAAFTLGSAPALAAELGDVLPEAPRIGAPA